MLTNPIKKSKMAIQKGDTVRYLNAVGGGKVVRIEGNIAYVDDEGFETPVRVNELVVVLPAGHAPEKYGKSIFDQKAFDAGRSGRLEEKNLKTEPEAALPREEEDFPIEETEYGDDMTVVLAFEPKDIKKLSETSIGAYLVNDSNYFLDYQLLAREGEAGWTAVSRGTAAPNELVDLGRYTQESVRQLERIVFQAIAYKKDKEFEFKPPVSASRKLDLTKFYKLHCFRPGVYFDTPVLEVPILAEQPRKRD